MWWWWVESEFSDRLSLSSGLALAKPNNITCHHVLAKSLLHLLLKDRTQRLTLLAFQGMNTQIHLQGTQYISCLLILIFMETSSHILSYFHSHLVNYHAHCADMVSKDPQCCKGRGCYWLQ